MNRRGAILAGAGLAAVAVGAGTALRRRRADSDDADAPEVTIDVWSLAFQSVDGAPMPMSALRGRPLLLNFWATWCGPCVIEMPLLDRFAREQGPRGWRVLALAIDQPDPVRRFIAERTLRLPVAIAGAVGLDLSRQLGNVHGGLPFTAAFDSAGAAVQRRLGAVNAELLAAWSAGTR
ncbi:MAG TPA: TlpA disulfide reductase family protein [Caldimonas sp.]|jgi:thiol-disulfide isomerase/thioredoxin|nr:TlpA disulfide reductase family protein [Caldimonas sp.]